jgi:septin family protein
MIPEPTEGLSEGSLSKDTEFSTIPPTKGYKNIKKKARFGIMVGGRAGIGKTTFLATLLDPFLEPLKFPKDPSIEDEVVFESTETIGTISFEAQVGKNQLFIEAIDTPGYGEDLAPGKL